MIFVKLTGTSVAKIDDGDAEKIAGTYWYPVFQSGKAYAYRMILDGNGKRKSQSLHRYLTNAAPHEEVDHKNNDGLDCTRANMRVTDKRGNARSIRKKSAGKSSKFRGVSWHKPSNKWAARACVRIEGRTKNHYVGLFGTEEDAALAYNRKATELGFFPEALNKVA